MLQEGNTFSILSHLVESGPPVSQRGGWIRKRVKELTHLKGKPFLGKVQPLIQNDGLQILTWYPNQLIQNDRRGRKSWSKVVKLTLAFS